MTAEARSGRVSGMTEVARQIAPERMPLAQFLAWEEAQPLRHERVGGPCRDDRAPLTTTASRSIHVRRCAASLAARPARPSPWTPAW